MKNIRTRIILVYFLLTTTFAVVAIPMELPANGQTSSKTTSQADLEKGKKFYAQGVTQLSKGDLAGAKQAFEASLKHYPNIYSLLGLAEVAFQENRLPEASKYIQDAAKIAPDNADTQASLARLYVVQGNNTGAEAAFKKSIQLEPKLAKNYIDLGDLYLQKLNQPEQAIQSYKTALEIEPEHAGAHYALGVAYLRNDNNIQLAEKELKLAAQLEPKNPLPGQMLGQIYTKTKRYDEALKVYSDLIAKYPKLPAAHFGRGNVYLAQNNLAMAEKEFRSLVTIDPKNVAAWMNLGLVCQTQKKWYEAENAYLTAIKLQPDLVLAYNNLAWMSADQNKNLNKSLEWAREAVRLQPEVADFHDTLGWVHKARKEYPQAIAAFNTANKIKEQPQTYYHLGLVYVSMGEKAKAKTALNKALSLSNNFNEAPQAKKLLGTL